MMRCAFYSSLLIAYYFLQLRNVQHATLLVFALILPHDHHGLDIGRQRARRGAAASPSNSLRNPTSTRRLRPRFARRDEIRLERERAIIMLERLVRPVELEQRDADIAEHVRIVRIERKGAGEMLDRPGADHRRRRMALNGWSFLAKSDDEFAGGSDTNSGTVLLMYWRSQVQPA
jgi:hypothetical protein